MPRFATVLMGGLVIGTAAVTAVPGAARAATDVGVAAAVNPDATGRAGATTRQLSIGNNIFFNERISTSANGLVQVLFVDGSTITVGPNSDVVIDKFVYDPRKNTGEIAATFTKGALRFVGGKISKQAGAVKFDTPVGTLGIRGGMFQGAVGGGQGTFSFLFGDEMTFDNQSIFEHNYTVDAGGGGGPSIRPTRPEDAAFFVKQFSGQGGGGGGAGGGPNDGQVKNSGIGGQNSDGGKQGGPSNPFNNPANVTDKTGNENTTSDVIRDMVNNQPPPPQGETVEARVLLAPQTYFAFRNPDGTGGINIPKPYETGILGGDDNMDVDDFVTTAQIVNGRFKATVSGLTGSEEVCDGNNACQINYFPIGVHRVDFPFFKPVDTTKQGWQNTPGLLNQLGGLSTYMVGLAHNARIVAPDEIIRQTGFLSVADGFFAYQLFGTYIDGNVATVNTNERMLVLGGTPYVPEANQGTGKLREFSLLTDTIQGTLFPFASSTSSPDDENGARVSRLLVLEQNTGAPGTDSDDGSRTVWLQTGFQISGDGPNQQSFILVAAGLGVDNGEGLGLYGERRGGAMVFKPDESLDGAVMFSGGIATLAGPEGNHLFGTHTPNFVIGFDSTGATHNVGTDEPLDMRGWQQDELHGATYHVGTQVAVGAAPTRDGGTFKGYAAGMLQSRENIDGWPRMLGTTAPGGFELALDAATNQLSASMQARDLALLGLIERTYNLEFGTRNGGGLSAFIDDARFAALETPGGSSVRDRLLVFSKSYDYVDARSYIVSGGMLDANEQIFGARPVNTDVNGVVHAFCTACDFVKWGIWGTSIRYGDDAETADTENVHIGWWVAGDIARRNQLPTSGTATYSGSAVGTVASLEDDDWSQYVARGDMTMSWNFARRSGNLHITNFDGHNFGGRMLAVPGPNSGPNQFAGGLTGSGATGNIAGAATGSFVHPIHQQAPGGVIGNFGVGNAIWQASGIFAGAKN